MTSKDVISTATKREMHSYLLSDSRMSIDSTNTDSDTETFLKDQIEDMARKLYVNLELYICKSELTGNNGRITLNKNYKCLSNKLIYDTLIENIETNMFSDEELDKQMSKVDKIDINELDLIPESGSLVRKRLIRACKLLRQYNNADFSRKDKREQINSFEMDIESHLAEQVIAKYSKEILEDKADVFNQRQFRYNCRFAQAIKPDTLIIAKQWAIVIDVKVYSKLTYEANNKDKYISNVNRFQVNSYMGKVLERYYKNSKDSNINILGIILHIANRDIMNDKSVRDMNGCDLSVEDSRRIKLYIIEDKGLDYILNEYERIIKSEIETIEQD